jgi:hypothetical protein
LSYKDTKTNFPLLIIYIFCRFVFLNKKRLNEKNFIKKLQKGNQIAFGQLLDAYQQKVFGTCISLIPNKEDAEDVSQEVFIAVFKSIHQFK